MEVARSRSNVRVLLSLTNQRSRVTPTPFCSARAPPRVGARIFLYAPGALSKVLPSASVHAAVRVGGSRAWYAPVATVRGALRSVATLCGVCQRSSNLKEGAGGPRCPLASRELAVLCRASPYVTIPFRPGPLLLLLSRGAFLRYRPLRW